MVNYNISTNAQVDPIQSVTAICHSYSNGLLQILNPDTSFGYTYHWVSAIGDILISSDFVIDSLSAGTYILHMSYDSTDGCTTTDTVEITEYTEITSIPNEVDVDCYGDNTGSITANQLAVLLLILIHGIQSLLRQHRLYLTYQQVLIL